MTYTKRPDIVTGMAGESVVEFDDGSLAAVACQHIRCEITQAPVFEVSARWVDEAGATKSDAHNLPVETRHRHHSTHAEIARHTLPSVVRACLCLVLGEVPEVHAVDGELVPRVPFSAEIADQQSIRKAIAAAKLTFEPVDTASIL